MKQSVEVRVLLAAFLLCACMTPCVSAFIVSSVNVTPAGYQPAGTALTAVSVINFPATGATTFAPDGELQLSTDLVDAQWVPVVVVDGKETMLGITGGGELVLPGRNLSYLPSQSVQLNLTVSGKMPSDRHPGQTILSIRERDAAKKVVNSDEVVMPEVTLMPTTPPARLTNAPATEKTAAPVPAATTRASPAWTGMALIAVAGAALLVMRRR